MAGEIPPLILGVTLDTAGVSVGIDKTKTQLNGLGVQAEETGKKFSGMGKSMIAGLAATAAIVGAAKFLKEAVKAAEEMQVANTKLATSLNNAKQNTEANRIAIEKSTMSMENLGFQASETKNAFSTLVTEQVQYLKQRS